MTPQDNSGTATRSVRDSVRSFYDGVGWARREGGAYEDGARYEDPREVAAEYLHRCHRRVERYLPKSGRFLLDAGCGAIQYDEYLAYSRNHHRRVCVDLSLTGLRGARSRLGQHGLYVVADLAQMPFRDDVFDGCVCISAIYHVDASSQRQCFLELYRLLAPGSQGAVAYSWGKYSPAMFLVDTVPKKLGSMLARRRRSESGSGPVLYFHPQSFLWFRRDVASRMPVDVRVWRSLSVFFMRHFIPDNALGRLGLKLVFWLEDRAPWLAGVCGQYPLLVLRKGSTPGWRQVEAVSRLQADARSNGSSKRRAGSHERSGHGTL